MKLCIFGSRSLSPALREIDCAVDELVACTRLWFETARISTNITQVITGGADGVDTIGEAWARCRGVQSIVYLADWRGLGSKAGPVRNAQMADQCDAAVGFWDGQSRGTEDMIRKLKRRHRPYLVIEMARTVEYGPRREVTGA